jgi:nitroreductase
MEFEQVVNRRRMVRAFDPRPLAPGTVDRLLQYALHAPSAGFAQGWSYLVLEGDEETARFWGVTFPEERRETFAHQGLFRAPALIVPFAHKASYLRRYAEPDKGWTDEDERRWPVPYWYVDAAYGTMLILLGVVDEGLGALFFGIFPENVDAFRSEFGVPDDYDPIGAIALGHPAPDVPSPSLRRGRRPTSEIVHRGRW